MSFNFCEFQFFFTKIIENYFNELCEEASNVYTRLEILEEFSKNEDWRLRLAVASNPKASKQILDRLRNDEIVEVREAAEINFKNQLLKKEKTAKCFLFLHIKK